jgi:hypothetical protein
MRVKSQETRDKTGDKEHIAPASGSRPRNRTPRGRQYADV